MKKNRQNPRSNKIAADISRNINLWLKEKDRLVVGIEGYSASGKTTIADCLAETNSGVVVIHLDDLLRSSEDRMALMNSGKDRSKVFELEWYRYDLLQNIVAKFSTRTLFSTEIYDYDLKKMVNKFYDLSKPVMVIEGIFLFHSEHAISKVFDKKIYLAVDFERADSRRTRREKKRWGNEYVDEAHPDSFVRPFKEAYRRYFNNYKLQELADLVIEVA